MDAPARLDLLAVGRISVDLYACEPHASFAQQQSFIKSIGGSPTNVAVAAARLGLRTALVTGVGADELGDYACARLSEFEVDATFVKRVDGCRTPLVLASRNPPEEPAILFFRDAHPPDTLLELKDLPAACVRSSALLWASGAALAAGPTADSLMAWMSTRDRQGVVLDLDYRPALWASIEDARAGALLAIDASSVVVGNRTECRMAVGTDDPDQAADALLGRGVTMAVIKMGAQGSLVATTDTRVRVAAPEVDVVSGLGAGDAFGGALAYALVHEWPIAEAAAWANAAGALVASRPTCADDMPTFPELRAFQARHATVRSAGR